MSNESRLSFLVNSPECVELLLGLLGPEDVASYISPPRSANVDAGSQAVDLQVRDQFAMRIELDDWPGDPELLRVTVSISYVGNLHQDAKVAVVPKDILNTFDCSDYIFFDQVDESVAGMLPMSTAELSYHDLESPNQTIDMRSANFAYPGELEFSNDAFRRAKIECRIAYPYPRGCQKYPIIFKGYQIRGQTRISFISRSSRVLTVEAYTFLGSSNATTTEAVSDREVVVTTGHENEMIPGDSGMVFTWHEEGPNLGR